MNRQNTFLAIYLAFVALIGASVFSSGWSGVCEPGLSCTLHFLFWYSLVMLAVYIIIDKLPDRRIMVSPKPDVIDHLLLIEIQNKDTKNDIEDLRVELMQLFLTGHREIVFDNRNALFHIGNEKERIIAGDSITITLALENPKETVFLIDNKFSNNIFRIINRHPFDISRKWKLRLGGKNKRAYYQFVLKVSGKIDAQRIIHKYNGTIVHWVSEYDQQFDTIFKELLPPETRSGILWVKFVMQIRV